MKNLLPLATMLLFSAVSIAQLFVKPNGATDSYVYVNDQVLYVDGYVNLQENNPGTTRASIYLRNESQLVQGGTVSSNTGNGYISVFQNVPDDDAWDYTFWGSPVGITSGSGNQNFGVGRVNDSLSLTNSVVALTTPGHNGGINPLTISRRWLYRRPAGVNNYAAINTSNVVPPGYGFTMKGVGTVNHNQIYDFRGRANSGNISVAVIPGTSVLAGNPYPSALDLNRVFYDADNTEISEFWYWDEDRTVDSHLFTQNKGGFGIYVPGPNDPNGTTDNGFYTPAPFLNYDAGGNPSGGQTGAGAVYARRFAPIGQGFDITTPNAGGDGVIIFKNSHRRYIKEGAANGSQFRTPVTGSSTGADPGGTVTEPDDRLPHLRINVKMNNSHIRQLVLAFFDEATEKFDRGLDGRSPMDATSEAYFPIGDGNEMEEYVIQTLPFENGTVRVPLNLKLNGQTTVKFTTVEQVNMDREAYLYDNVTNTYHNFTQDSGAEKLLPAGHYQNRFFIVFRNNGSTSDPNSELSLAAEQRNIVIESVEFFQNNPVSQLEVTNPEGYTIKSAHIYDMSGKLVVSRNDIGDAKNFTFSTATLSDGVYLVKLTTDDDIAIDYKITIRN
ncbi:MAG: T9SS type A sorting domain-containing protein [Altibacter sp.]|nr:T9SS type A sorting domain-containing protein [Altibacter sp.]